MAWHRDGDYIRLTFFLEDTPEGGGGTAFLPGSHLVDAVRAERKTNLEKTLAMFFYREETASRIPICQDKLRTAKWKRVLHTL